jgi:hypothetical protein
MIYSKMQRARQGHLPKLLLQLKVSIILSRAISTGGF